MKLIDKLLLVLLCVFTICIGLALISAAIGFPLNEAVLQSIAAAFQRPLFALCVCLVALVIGAIAVRLLIAVFGKDATAKRNVQVFQSESGASYVTVNALNSMVRKFVQTDERVKAVKTSLKVHDGAASITARISAKPGVSIPEMTEQLQNRIKSHIEAYSGAKVDKVQVIIEMAEEASTQGRVS